MKERYKWRDFQKISLDYTEMFNFDDKQGYTVSKFYLKEGRLSID